MKHMMFVGLMQRMFWLAGFGSGFGMYNSSPNTLPLSRILSSEYNFQVPSCSGLTFPQKSTKSKIPGNVSLPNGLAKHHQSYHGESKDGSKDSVLDIFAETLYPCGNEKLYEAYNDLHSLAQDFHKPFDAPAIVVVGHQTDGRMFWPEITGNKRSGE
jgi:hypothetical protein